MNRILIPLIFGIAGAAVLFSLGAWQLRRLEWKNAVLAQIEARIDAAPVTLLPASPNPQTDRFLPVAVQGATTGEELHVLVSQKRIGPGYRIVSAFETGGRRVMLDQGFVPSDAKTAARPPVSLTVTGNLHWPEERDRFTPEDDVAGNTWFARDVGKMAGVLGTEPVLIVARSKTGPGIQPLPVDTSGIPNNHLGYAVQWFGLGIVWLGMTGYWLWRNRRQRDGESI